MDYGFHKKSRGKTKQANDIIASTVGPDSDVNSLTHSEKGEEGPHHQQEEGLLPLPVSDVGVMSGHPDLLDDNRQCMARSCRKADGLKCSDYNVVIASTTGGRLRCQCSD